MKLWLLHWIPIASSCARMYFASCEVRGWDLSTCSVLQEIMLDNYLFQLGSVLHLWKIR